MKDKSLLSLSMTRPGQKVRLINIDAGDNLKSRLAAMGILPNVEFTVVSNACIGPFVVNVKGSKIALGRGMARKLTVKAVD